MPDAASVQQMSDFVTAVTASLVDAPSAVRVESESFEAETVLRVHVAPDDLGKLIGKQGRTARALRTIVSAAGSKLHHRFNLDVQSDES